MGKAIVKYYEISQISNIFVTCLAVFTVKFVKFYYLDQPM